MTGSRSNGACLQGFEVWLPDWKNCHLLEFIEEVLIEVSQSQQQGYLAVVFSDIEPPTTKWQPWLACRVLILCLEAFQCPRTRPVRWRKTARTTGYEDSRRRWHSARVTVTLWNNLLIRSVRGGGGSKIRAHPVIALSSLPEIDTRW